MSQPQTDEPTSILSDLPAELIHEIISYLDDSSLVQFSLTCKRYHKVALTTFFNKNDIQSPSQGWLVAHQTPSATLDALRVALWVKEIKQLHFYFNPGIERLLAEVRDMYYLFKRLPNVKLVKLHFAVVDTCIASHLKGSMRQLDRQLWFKLFTRLLDMIIEKGCTELQVTGGAKLKTSYLTPEGILIPRSLRASPLAINTAIPTEVPTPQSEYNGVNYVKPNRVPEYVAGAVEKWLSSQGLQRAPEEVEAQKQQKRSRKFWPPKKLISFIQRKKREKPVATGTVLPKPPLVAEAAIDSAHEPEGETVQQIQEPPKQYHLTNVGILSDMLLQNTFFHWTVGTLNNLSSVITTLSFKCPYVPTKTWSSLLHSLSLPKLEDFEIATDLIVSSNGAPFEDLEDFFGRHPSITKLHLQGVGRYPKAPNIHEPILPKLASLMSHPTWVISLLKLSALHPFPRLTSIGISTEYYQYNPTFDYDLIDDALFRLADFALAGQGITLTLRFMCANGVSEWFEGHVFLGTENSVLSRLYCVSTLVISGSFFVDVARVTGTILPTWLGLFPCVEQVKFIEMAEDQYDLLENPEFLRRVAEQCPKVNSVEVPRCVYVDEFKRVDPPGANSQEDS